MFDHDYNNYGLSPLNSLGQNPLLMPTQPEVDVDDRDEAWEAIARFAGLFSLGILITLLARWLPPLRPFYWLGVAGLIAYLALGSYLSRNPKLVALAVITAVAIAAGHWDYLNYQGQQTIQSGQQTIQRIQEQLPR